MRGVAGSLVVSLLCAASVGAQERDRALERISLALQQPLPAVRGIDAVDSVAPKKFGIFTLVPAQGPGEIVRISVPIGELVSRAFKSVAAAARRRQEAAARRMPRVRALQDSWASLPSIGGRQVPARVPVAGRR